MTPGPDALLGLMWLASPALPVGGFSYSEALEAAVEDGTVHDAATAGDWLADQLHLGLGRADLPLVAAAHAAWSAHDAPRVAALNAWVLATRETAELRAQCEQMGRSMHEWLRQQAHNGTRGHDSDGTDARVATLGALAPAPAWPVAFALAAVRTGADAHASLLAYGFSWAENQVQAALKAVPLGLPAVARLALDIDDDARQAFTPLLAVRSALHETQYSRLFRS
jgi:urease accessory protein